ncbi:G-type lectin S-receptor-like serine threonine-kinase At4g27290 isoform X1 [Olea europaea subsp. europaea]|uniref:non-specific serine/threonine protein kinase n=1 Tax=Olea europaea subsp. europaea TaxID=158383 RepID=A0A8S0PLE9_OLEEU|nr:G-type lectin S-receptor-like serine threonine-kinase At4g27290 isoform X1 [Olea europaea subsp. europaea]
MKKSSEDISFLLVLSSLLYILEFSTAIDIINTTQIIKDGDTLVSYGGIFELGFFSPDNSKNRYLGIWYKKIPGRTVVWVANKETPIRSTTCVLKIIEPGFLVILDDSNNTIWSSNTSRVAQTPILQLLDSGNLVLREANDYNPDNFVWQSFDYLTNTFLPGVNLGWNYETGVESYLTSWKSNEDPAPGDFTFHLDPTGYPFKRKEKKNIDIKFDFIDGSGSAMPKLDSVLLEKEEKLLKWKNRSHRRDFELPLFSLSTISKATDNFSIYKKLGQGRYGPVYKGMLEDGQEIAVKRLSKSSMQGLDEFKNEVICIAKLQHRNLVKLLGCCIEGEEKMLIYESMPNKSLDLILFDQTKSMLLDWSKRLQVLNGVARGIMYIHQDSRLRIVHRDLKVSNILLDTDMNPKISDFGIAKSFQENETEDKTSRVVGTYGYMSPEYAVHGQFSMKSEVFSFGVIVLETVSGKRNSGFSSEDQHLNFLGHAWTLYKEGRSFELVDTYLHAQLIYLKCKD